MLNNVFYQNLVDSDLAWTQQLSPRNLWEWRVDINGRDILMLNSDMSMVMAIDDYFDPTDPDRVLCTIDTCPDSIVKFVVDSYAANNQLWLEEFSLVFIQMITTGYDISTELERVDANPLNGVVSAKNVEMNPLGQLYVADYVHDNGNVGDKSINWSVWMTLALVICFGSVWLMIGVCIGNCNRRKQTEIIDP